MIFGYCHDPNQGLDVRVSQVHRGPETTPLTQDNHNTTQLATHEF